jgi:glycosyltransferase involved in cell wall biosynthesis
LKADISVIIPTYNRKKTLLRTLEAYKRQSAGGEILEVVVVDDGSTDGTGEATAQAALGSPFPIRYLRQDNHGQGLARNLGIRSADGELVLLGDDDIIPTPTLVAEHAAWHRKHPSPSVAVLGYVAWSPELKPTPFMEWLALDGILFDYGHLSPGCTAGFMYFYSCNISLKRRFLLDQGMFDEDFHTYGYEDSELGYRLMQRGLRLLYNPAAIGHHYKRMSFADVCRRAKMTEVTYELYKTKVPAEARGEQPPSGKAPAWRRARRKLFSLLAPALGQLAFVLDTQIPLPWSVYRGFYDYVVPRVKTKQRTSLQP